MGFWIFMLVMDAILPVMMVILGKLFMVKPPKHINCLYGYRTPMSMKNESTWEFAQKYWGGICFKLGLATLFTPLLLLPFTGSSEDTVGIAGCVINGAQVAVLFITIIITEKALKKNFNEYGEKI